MTPQRIFLIGLCTAALAACSPYQSYNNYPDETPEGNQAERHSPTSRVPADSRLVDKDELIAYHWTLERATDSGGISDSDWVRPSGERLTLNFDDDRIGVSGLCNSIGGNYRISGADMEIMDLHSTKRMCADQSLMQYEQAVAQRLRDVTNWAITRTPQGSAGQPALTLRFKDDAQWVLSATPTAKHTYGGDGETMFLEIAPQTIQCADPVTSAQQCLSVRTVQYDASGIQQSRGEWQPFYGTIDGYQHNEGVRNIVRIKRYPLRDTSTSAARHAYVLDTIVESEAANSTQAPAVQPGTQNNAQPTTQSGTHWPMQQQPMQQPTQPGGPATPQSGVQPGTQPGATHGIQ